jgi:hypothetical protein
MQQLAVCTWLLWCALHAMALAAATLADILRMCCAQHHACSGDHEQA